MFKLPESTNIKKIIFKNKIFDKYRDELKGKKKEKFDREIGRIIIINEISEKTIKLPRTKEISSIFVIKIELKTRDYTDSNIVLITKLFGQNILYILNFEDEYKLAVYKDKLITSPWKREDQINLSLQGIDLLSVWENLIIKVGDIDLEDGNTLEEQIEIDDRRAKLEKLIEQTRKKMGREVQAKRKHELFKEIKKYEEELERYNG